MDATIPPHGHESFCQGMGLDASETSIVGAIIEQLSVVPDATQVEYERVKAMAAEHGGREPVAIAAYSLLKALKGERLMYLLLGSIMPSMKAAK